MAGEHIIIVDDEADIQELISYNLKKNGYSINCLDNGESCINLFDTLYNNSSQNNSLQNNSLQNTGLQNTKSQLPKLVLLDLMLPGLNGLDVCRKLKNNPTTANTPIIIISAKGEDADIVSGLELGADDYLVKPFSPRVLLARVRSVLRRVPGAHVNPHDGIIKYKELSIDKNKHVVSLHQQPLELTATEFNLLSLLVNNPGKVYSRCQIVEQTKGDDYPVTDRSIDVQVVGLRRKLGTMGHIIETVRGVGYRCKEVE